MKTQKTGIHPDPTSARNQESTGSLGLGRRDLLRAGLGGAAAVVTGGAIRGETTPAPQNPPDNGKRTPQHRIIDTHNHPRWVGYNGARIIQDMDNAGIERTWLLRWELPEVEMASTYYREAQIPRAWASVS